MLGPAMLKAGYIASVFVHLGTDKDLCQISIGVDCQILD